MANVGKVVGRVGLAAEEDQAATTPRDQVWSASVRRVIGCGVHEPRREACACHAAWSRDHAKPLCDGVQAAAVAHEE